VLLPLIGRDRALKRLRGERAWWRRWTVVAL